MTPGDQATVVRVFSAQELQDYARLSGHHFNRERIPEPLVGMLFSYLLGVKLPGKGTMYLKQATHFPGVAVVGEQLTARVEITRLRPAKHLADLSTTCTGEDGRIIASGRALVYTGDVAQRVVESG